MNNTYEQAQKGHQMIDHATPADRVPPRPSTWWIPFALALGIWCAWIAVAHLVSLQEEYASYSERASWKCWQTGPASWYCVAPQR